MGTYIQNERRELLMTTMSNIVELMVQEWAVLGRPKIMDYPATYLHMLDALSGMLVDDSNEKAGFIGHGNPG